MSHRDDRNAEFEARLDYARRKCAYGRKFSAAYDVARMIEALQSFWLTMKERTTGLHTLKTPFVVRVAGLLLLNDLTSSAQLREVADALDAKRTEDPRQINILEAYLDCVEGRYPPTLVKKTESSKGGSTLTCLEPTFAQLRDAFVKRFGEHCWTSDYGVRKTLRMLRLPLSNAKRGRPVGPR